MLTGSFDCHDNKQNAYNFKQKQNQIPNIVKQNVNIVSLCIRKSKQKYEVYTFRIVVYHVPVYSEPSIPDGLKFVACIRTTGILNVISMKVKVKHL